VCSFTFEIALNNALAGLPTRLDWDEGEQEQENALLFRTMLDRAAGIRDKKTVVFEQEGVVFATHTYSTEEAAHTAMRDWLGFITPDRLAEASTIEHIEEERKAA